MARTGRDGREAEGEAQPSNAFHPMDAFEAFEACEASETSEASETFPQPPGRSQETFRSISPPGSFEPSGPGPQGGPQPPTGTPPFDPQQEYRRLLDVVSAEDRERELDRTRKSPATPGGADQDAYQQLMSRERRVLDTVDRVVNDDVARRSARSGILSMSLAELCFRCVSALRGLFDDLIDAASARSLADALAALRNPHRLPFLGVTLVALALMLAALQAL